MECARDGILEKNVYSILRCVEMISLLRVHSILHISICLPLYWLAGNCGNLGKYGFGVADMPMVLDLMYDAFGKMVQDGRLILDEDFNIEMQN